MVRWEVFLQWSFGGGLTSELLSLLFLLYSFSIFPRSFSLNSFQHQHLLHHLLLLFLHPFLLNQGNFFMLHLIWVSFIFLQFGVSLTVLFFLGFAFLIVFQFLHLFFSFLVYLLNWMFLLFHIWVFHHFLILWVFHHSLPGPI